MPNLTGKTIGQLTALTGITQDTLFPVELSGNTFHIPFSGTNVINITYNELYNKLINQTLTPNINYRLVDYKSVNFLNGFLIADSNPTPIVPSFNPRQIHTGDTEVLLLYSISNSLISEKCYSETFKEDVITYLPYVNKIGVNLDFYNGKILPDSSVMSGFDLEWDSIDNQIYFNMPSGYPAYYGHYFYLYCEFDNGSYYSQDGYYEPLLPNGDCQFSFLQSNSPINMTRIRLENDGQKVILLDLTYDDYTAYTTNSLYVEHIESIGDSFGWITRRNSVSTDINVPFDYRAQKFRRYEVNMSTINSELGTNYWGIGDNFLGLGTTGNYKDFYSLDWEKNYLRSIYFDGVGGPWGYYNGHTENNVFFRIVSDIKIGNEFYENTIGSYFVTNSIGIDFRNNVINNGFSENNISNQFTSNRISNGFSYNEIKSSFNANKIKAGFQYNSISYGFVNNTINQNFYGNITNGIFNTNVINIECKYNIFGDSTTNNIIGESFINNSINNRFSLNNIGNDFQSNFISSTSYDYYTFNNGFYSNTIGNNFKLNTIKTTVSLTNFNTAYHVYANYNCEIFKNSLGNNRLSYYSGDTLTITNVTS